MLLRRDRDNLGDASQAPVKVQKIQSNAGIGTVIGIALVSVMPLLFILKVRRHGLARALGDLSNGRNDRAPFVQPLFRDERRELPLQKGELTAEQLKQELAKLKRDLRR